MWTDILKELRPAAVVFIALSLVTGILYPVVVTAIGWAAFPSAAGGSLIVKDGKAIGSRLIGQPFDDEKYFWSRPSATGPHSYNAGASSGSNLGPTNPTLIDGVKTRIAALQAADPTQKATIPVDLVTASASGLDPHISPAAAYYQVPRVARVRGLPVEQVKQLVERQIEPRTLGILGEPRVNVLLLNLALDADE